MHHYNRETLHGASTHFFRRSLSCSRTRTKLLLVSAILRCMSDTPLLGHIRNANRLNSQSHPGAHHLLEPSVQVLCKVLL